MEDKIKVNFKFIFDYFNDLTWIKQSIKLYQKCNQLSFFCNKSEYFIIQTIDNTIDMLKI